MKIVAEKDGLKLELVTTAEEGHSVLSERPDVQRAVYAILMGALQETSVALAVAADERKSRHPYDPTDGSGERA